MTVSGADTDEALQIAKSILDGSMPILLGCRKIVGPLRRLRLDCDDQFVIFIGVNSETDHLPVDPEERKLWNAQALVQKDQEIAGYTSWAERLAIPACHEIVRRFSQ